MYSLYVTQIFIPLVRTFSFIQPNSSKSPASLNAKEIFAKLFFSSRLEEIILSQCVSGFFHVSNVRKKHTLVIHCHGDHVCGHYRKIEKFHFQKI